MPSEQLFITDFAFHSISVILTRLKQSDVLIRFVQDVFADGNVVEVYLMPDDTARLVEVMEKFNLDFDDAYQYVAAEQFKLTLVSFDAGFDRTALGRSTPMQVVERAG